MPDKSLPINSISCMTVKSLKLHHFRNINHLNLNLDSGFNFFFGKNAQGKTNVIEAIYYLAELKSFRATNKNDLIQNGQEFAKLEADVEKDGLESRIQVTLSENKKQVLVNDKKPKSRKDYAEWIPVLLFEPRHIYLFRDSPSLRRKYLHRALYLQDATTLSLVRDYDKIIAQKNKILKDPLLQHGKVHSHLDAWNDRLAQLGSDLIYKRLQWFQEIELHLSEEYESLSHSGETLKFIYKPSQNLFSDVKNFSELDHATIQQRLYQKLNDRQHDEIIRREAFVGPHRDDFQTCLNDRDVALYGSQGENRSAIIALKLSQLKLFAKKFKKTPLFLLDDVASELDADRCHYLFSYLRDESVQAFLTTTENDRITDDFSGKSQTFLVKNGEISAMN